MESWDRFALSGAVVAPPQGMPGFLAIMGAGLSMRPLARRAREMSGCLGAETAAIRVREGEFLDGRVWQDGALVWRGGLRSRRAPRSPALAGKNWNDLLGKRALEWIELLGFPREIIAEGERVSLRQLEQARLLEVVLPGADEATGAAHCRHSPNLLARLFREVSRASILSLPEWPEQFAVEVEAGGVPGVRRVFRDGPATRIEDWQDGKRVRLRLERRDLKRVWTVDEGTGHAEIAPLRPSQQFSFERAADYDWKIIGRAPLDGETFLQYEGVHRTEPNVGRRVWLDEVTGMRRRSEPVGASSLPALTYRVMNPAPVRPEDFTPVAFPVEGTAMTS